MAVVTTEKVKVSLEFRFERWPACERCKQSCTGSYVGKPKCIRCSSDKLLASV